MLRASSLAEQIDAYILGFAVNASNNYLGTPGNAVSLYDDVASGYTRLKEEGVDDTDLRAVLTYGDKQALGSAGGDGTTRPPDQPRPRRVSWWLGRFDCRRSHAVHPATPHTLAAGTSWYVEA